MWKSAQDRVTVERIGGQSWMNRENRDKMEGYKK